MRNIFIFIPVLVLLPLVCCQLSHLRTPIFTHYSEHKSWKAAQTFCREKHTDLATVSEEHNDDLHDIQGWIGLYRDDVKSPWKWSRRDEIATFLPWDENEPDSTQHCGYKYLNTEKWQNGHCVAYRSFICFDEKLFLVRENKTWEEALKHCRSLKEVDSEDPYAPSQNHRYDLASLITLGDIAFAKERALEATTEEVWIGLRYLAGGWVWVGGEQVRVWDVENCPAPASCGTLDKDAIVPLRKRQCDHRRNFFCYLKPAVTPN